MGLLGPMVGQGASGRLWSGSVAVLQLPPAGDGTVLHRGTEFITSAGRFSSCSTQAALLVNEVSIAEPMPPVSLWVDDNILVVFSVTLTLHRLLFGAAQTSGSTCQ